MKKIYCMKCYKYGKFKNLKISHVNETVPSIISGKCGNNDEKIFTEVG